MSPDAANSLLLSIPDISSRIEGYTDELAQLCGYLPVALRLAGSVLAEEPDVEPREYIRRLKNNLLEELNPIEESRENSIEATIKLSYDLLTPELQKFFTQLSIFPHSFDREAVEAVWNPHEENGGNIDTYSKNLGRLYRYSLILWNKTTQRYHLHDLVKAFAANHIIPVDKVRASEIDDRVGTSKALGNLGNIYAELDNQDRAIENYKKQLEIARELQDKHSEANALLNLGVTYDDGDNINDAFDCCQQSLKIAREIGYRLGEAHACWNIGMIYEKQGDIEQAITFMQIQVTYLQSIKHPDVQQFADAVDDVRNKLEKKNE